MTVKILATFSIAPENPLKWSGDRLLSFNHRHRGFCRPDNLSTEVEDLEEKLRDGRAFWLGYSEHGDCRWMLSEQATNSWDSRTKAGLLVLAPDSYANLDRASRRAYAEQTLETYTNWCNGDVYDLQIASPCGHCGAETNEGESVCEVYPDSVDAEARELAGSEDFKVIYQ